MLELEGVAESSDEKALKDKSGLQKSKDSRELSNARAWNDNYKQRQQRTCSVVINDR